MIRVLIDSLLRNAPRQKLFLFVAAAALTLPSVAIGQSDGDYLGEHKGVAAYSNGGDIDGTRWQCVEYIKRFYRDAMGMNTSAWTGNGVDYYPSASNKGLDRYVNGGSVPPQSEDVIGFSGNTFGHVAVVVSVTGSTVRVIEQNWSRYRCFRDLTLTASGGKYTLSSGSSSYSVQGWLRKPGYGALATPKLVSPSNESGFPNGGRPELKARVDGGPEPSEWFFWLVKNGQRYWESGWIPGGFDRAVTPTNDMSPGRYEWAAKVRRNGVESEAPQSWALYINAAPPVPNLLEPAHESWWKATPTLRWQDPGDSDGLLRNFRDYRVRVRNVAGGWSFEQGWGYLDTFLVPSLPGSGRYLWTVAAGDGWNDNGDAPERAFGYDPVAPSIPSITPNAPSGSNGPTITLMISATDDFSGVAFTEVFADGVSIGKVNGASGTITYTVPSSGASVVFRATATDVAGNVGPATELSYAFDREAPTVASVAYLPNPPIQGPVSITVVAEDGGSGVSAIQIKVNGNNIGTISGTTGTVTWDATNAPVTSTLTIVVTDVAGNQRTDERELILDTTPPVVTATLNPAQPDAKFGWYKTAPTLTLTASAPSGVKAIYWRRTGKPYAEYTAPLVLRVGGVYDVTYYAVSKAGIESSPQTISLKIDTTLPPAPTVADEGETTPDGTTLAVSIGNLDPESGLSYIGYMVGDTSNPQRWRSETNLRTADPYLVIQGLNIPAGETAIVRLRTMNGAGVAGPWVATDGIRIAPELYPAFHRGSLLTGICDEGIESSLGDTAQGLSQMPDDSKALLWGYLATWLGYWIGADVYLEDFVGNVGTQSVTIEIIKSGTVVQRLTRSPAKVGESWVVYVESSLGGKADIRVKGSHWLSQSLKDVSVSSPLTAIIVPALKNGDINGDNRVDAKDSELLYAAYGSKPGMANWNPAADLNGDGIVDTKDKTILRNNTGLIGG